MPLQNTDIELSKYYDIKSQKTGKDNEQITKIGQFASIPRLLDVLCTVPLSKLSLKADIYIDGNKITKSNTISHNPLTQDIINDYSESNSEYVIEIGKTCNINLIWYWLKELYKAKTENSGIDKNKVVIKDIYTREPTQAKLDFNGLSPIILPTNYDNSNLTNNVKTSGTEVTYNLGNINSSKVTDLIISKTISTPILNAPLIEESDGNEYLRYGEGFISRSVSIKLKFRAYTYCGAYSSKPDTFTIANIKGLTKVTTENVQSDFCENRNRVVNNAVLTDNQYLVYAYPSYMGKLNDIIIDGGVSAINSFISNNYPKEITFDYGIKYYVYCTALPGCLNGSRIEFK